MNAPASTASLPNRSQLRISPRICSGVTSSQPPSGPIRVSMNLISNRPFGAASGGGLDRIRGVVGVALVGEVHHRAHLHGSVLERDPLRVLERLVEVIALEQVETPELLLGLGE